MMQTLILAALALPAGLMVLSAVLPARWIDRNVLPFRGWVSGLSAAQCALATLALAGQLIGRFTGTGPLSDLAGNGWIYYDGVSGLMFAMVALIGWVICRFSIRYLDGDPGQANYFRWTAFTLGAVSLMVISGNLLSFLAAWVMTSLGLHRLLLHFPDRPAARRAAWTKFVVARIGDGALGLAALFLYTQWGTLDFAELFSLAAEGSGTGANNTQVATALLVLAAATKSAQFPLHTWLPQTLDTPTPVSALMHAGIVNAGGYLIVRTSPLFVASSGALTVLAVLGAVTACYGAIVMMTQSSVKRSLAYSTVAQMGFMMLQCGLGAFSAAMLHIIAHSMYKAHAFLSSGSVIADHSPGKAESSAGAKAGPDGSLRDSSFGRVGWLAAVWVAACLFSGYALLGMDPFLKPGGLILGGVLSVALADWISRLARRGDRQMVYRGWATATALTAVYLALYAAVDFAVSPDVVTAPSASPLWLMVALVVAAGFLVMLQLQKLSRQGGHQPAGRVKSALYVHARNGFYVESSLRRVFGPLASS